MITLAFVVGNSTLKNYSEEIIPVGVILTTMCMDVVGRMYLKEIHYLGRKLKSNNPFYLLREAKARLLLTKNPNLTSFFSIFRRRRAAMASLLAQLAKGLIFAHKDYNELARKKSKRKKEKRRGSHVCESI